MSPASTVSGWGSVKGSSTNPGVQRQLATMAAKQPTGGGGGGGALAAPPSSAPGPAGDAAGSATVPGGGVGGGGAGGAGTERGGGSSAGGSTFADAREREKVIEALQNSHDVSGKAFFRGGAGGK